MEPRLRIGLIVAAVVVAVNAITAREAAAAGASLKVCVTGLEDKCGHVKLGGNRLEACFQEHMSGLPEGYSAAVARAASKVQTCKSDVVGLCGGRPASGAYACMKARMAEVSKPCRTAARKVALRGSFSR